MSFTLKHFKFTNWVSYILAIVVFIVIFNILKATTAYLLGDKSAKKYITLNPVKHFEPVGFIFLFIYGLGWGQEIDINSMNFKDRKKATLLVNTIPIVVCILLGFLVYLPLSGLNFINLFVIHFSALCFKNAIFNLIPIRPLNGEKILRAISRPDTGFKLSQNEKILQVILVFLMLFNILPIFINKIYYFVLG